MTPESSAAAAVLGAVLAFPASPEAQAAIERLGGDHFVASRHRVLFEAISSVVTRGALPDVVTVTDHLRVTGRLDAAGGALTVTALLDAAPAIPTLVGQHLDVLDRVALTTRAARMARELMAAARAGDPSAALVRVQRELHAASLLGPRRTAVLMQVRDVRPVPVRWAWPGRIPFGKVTVLDGDPGLGKSTVALDLAARLSTGQPMPDGTRADLVGPAGVVILSAEDDPADTIRPRLDAAGADVGRVVILQAVRDAHGLRGPTIADLDALREAQASVGAALVIVDPLMAHLPDARDSHRDQDVRRALAPLAAFAAETGAAVPVIRHLSKSGVDHPIYRGGGSIGIIGAARAGLLVAPDPDDETGARRILAVTKNNLAAPAPALAYRLVAAEGAVRVAWEGATAHTAAALLAAHVPAEERSALDEAVAFLRDRLADGPLPAGEVKTAARSAGIADRTLDRARHRAGVSTRKGGYASAPWVWALPEGSPFSPTPNPFHDGENGPDGENTAPPAFQPPDNTPSSHSRQPVGVGGHAAPLPAFARRVQEVFGATILDEDASDA